MFVCWVPCSVDTWPGIPVNAAPPGSSRRYPARIVITRPATPWWKVTVGTAAYTFPKSATTAPEDSVVSVSACTGSWTMRVRTETRCVHGFVPAGPSTDAAAQRVSSYPGLSQPTGMSGPLTFSL